MASLCVAVSPEIYEVIVNRYFYCSGFSANEIIKSFKSVPAPLAAVVRRPQQVTAGELAERRFVASVIRTLLRRAQRPSWLSWQAEAPGAASECSVYKTPESLRNRG